MNVGKMSFNSSNNKRNGKKNLNNKVLRFCVYSPSQMARLKTEAAR